MPVNKHLLSVLWAGFKDLVAGVAEDVELTVLEKCLSLKYLLSDVTEKLAMLVSSDSWKLLKLKNLTSHYYLTAFNKMYKN